MNTIYCRILQCATELDREDAAAGLFGDRLFVRNEQAAATSIVPLQALARQLHFYADEFASAHADLNRFLSAVAAHTYVFSNKGHLSHTSQRYKDIVTFIHSAFDKDVNALWTDEWKSNLVFR
ncbi:hypothetical protein [Bradyrhizobium elkanii]